jgi:hypothetical protein
MNEPRIFIEPNGVLNYQAPPLGLAREGLLMGRRVRKWARRL